MTISNFFFLQRWKYQTSRPVFSSPCRSHVSPSNHPMDSLDSRPLVAPPPPPVEVVLFGSHDHHVYCLSAQDGLLRWKAKLDSPVYSSPFGFSLPTCRNGCRVDHAFDGIKRLDSDGVGADEACPRVDEACLRAGEACPRADEACPRADEVCPRADEACPRAEEARPRADEACPRADEACPRADEVCPRADEACPRANEARPRADEACRYVAASCTTGVVYILDMSTGESLARYGLPGQVFSSPVVVNDRLIVGCRDNNVYCLTINFQ